MKEVKVTKGKKIIQNCFFILFIFLCTAGLRVYAEEYTLSRTKITLNVGEAYDLDVQGTDKTPYWTSWNVNKVKINQNGEVTALRTGKTTVSARVGLGVKKCTVTVMEPAIKLNKRSATIYATGTSARNVQLKATVKGASKAVQWKSGNPEIATVDKQGWVTAVATGNTVISVTANGKTEFCAITVKDSSISLDIDSMQLSTKGKGSSMTLTPTVVGSKKKVKWTTSDKNVATVSEGKVTGKGNGTAIITATANGVSASCKVTVIKDAVSIDTEKLLLYTGETKQLKNNAGKTDITTWSSSDSNVISVDATGKVTAAKAGNAVVTVSMNDTKDSCEVVVKENQMLIEEEVISLKTKGEEKIYFLNFDVIGRKKDVQWTTSDKNVATVKNGKITAKKAGTAIITATANRKSDSVEVKVTEYEPTIKLNQSEYTLYTKKGNTYALKATVDGASKKVTYTSSNPEVATVNAKGKVTAVGEGQTMVTATANNVSVQCRITVIESKVLLENYKLYLEKGERAQLPADIIGDNQKVKYVSVNPKIATVKKGIVTAKKEGETQIKVTANGVTSICQVLVEVCEHKFDEGIVTKESDCAAAGIITFTCTVCGETYTEDLPLKEHIWSDWKTVKEPTEIEVGEKKRVCSVCKEEETKEIPQTTHKHSYTSIITEPTCTKQGYTTYTCFCGDTYVDNYVKATDHSYTSIITEPTCTEHGYTTYTCFCGDTYVDNYVEATDHSWANWVITKEPTETEEGEKVRVCLLCGVPEKASVDKVVVEGDTMMQKIAFRLKQRKENNILEGVTPCRGDVNAIVLYITFPDYEPNTEYDAEDVENFFFDTTDSEEWSEWERTSHSLTTYFKNVSYGKLNFSGELFPYTMKKDYRQYCWEDNGLLILKENELMEEALDSFWDTREPADFDANKDGYLDAVYLVFANSDNYKTYVNAASYETEGYKASNVAVIGNNAAWVISTLAHETVHLMGLPDIYGGVGVNLAGTKADSIMDGQDADIPAIMKFFFGWYDDFQEVFTEGESEVSLKSYSTGPDMMILYPNGNEKSEFVFLVEYITQEKGNSNLMYLGEKGGLRIWRVLLNVDKSYGIKGNEYLIGLGNSPYLYLEAVHPFGETNYIVREGESWTPYTNPSSFFGTKVTGGEVSGLTEQLYSGIGITEFQVENGMANFKVTIESDAKKEEPKFEYIMKADSLSSKRNDNTWELLRVSGETEIIINETAESYVLADEEKYPVTLISGLQGDFISFLVSDEVHEKLIEKESVKLVIGENNIKTYYGAGNKTQEVELNIANVKALEKNGEQVSFLNFYGRHITLSPPQTVKLSDDEIVAVAYNIFEGIDLKEHIYRAIKYNISSNEITEIELTNSQDGIIEKADDLVEHKVRYVENGEFEILTRYKKEYYYDRYRQDGVWVSGGTISKEEFMEDTSNVCLLEDSVQRFAFSGKDLIMAEYDREGNLIRELTVLKELPINPEYHFPITIQKRGAEYTLSFMAVPEDALISYAHSYMYTVVLDEGMKCFYHYEEESTVNSAGFIRMTDKDYIMIKTEGFQKLSLP